MKTTKRYAIYRILYGEDFVQESIKSISDYVDKIFVFWTDRVLGNCTEVIYKNQIIQFPKKFDNVIDKIKELESDKVILIKDYVANNINQFTHLVNDLILPYYDKPDEVWLIEPDQVWRKDQIEKAIKEFDGHQCASFQQIELWKTPEYRIPYRKRVSCVFWNLRNLQCVPPAGRSAEIPNMPFLSAAVHNLGFCASEKVMRWKHLTSIAFSPVIDDYPPNPDWLDKVWLTWDFENNNSNLEISKGREHLIPFAVPYDIRKLPSLILEKYGWDKS